MARMLCVSFFLCFALCIITANANIEEGFENRQLQQDPLSRLDKLEDRQKQNLLDLFYKIFKSENENILHEPEDTEKREKNRRGVGSSFRTATRRPSCFVFFWKTWAAC
uniref:Somatostatin/Cortistatin C-terminal domain-containing protein n=1 Tax=Acanthochromis polyacanthus TaxID=80966 RepID=A0A3Q1EGQ9_9TELE